MAVYRLRRTVFVVYCHRMLALGSSSLRTWRDLKQGSTSGNVTWMELQRACSSWSPFRSSLSRLLATPSLWEEAIHITSRTWQPYCTISASQCPSIISDTGRCLYNTICVVPANGGKHVKYNNYMMYVHICNSIIQILAYIRIEIASPAIIFITCAYKHDTAALQHIK